MYSLCCRAAGHFSLCDNIVTRLSDCNTQMQTRSSSKSPNHEVTALPPDQRGRKVNPTPGPAKKTVEKSHWTPEEEERLISFLVSRKSEAGDGGSFKSVIWTAAVQEMAMLPPTKGIIKNAAACSSKYNRVCTTYSCSFSQLYLHVASSVLNTIWLPP